MAPSLEVELANDRRGRYRVRLHRPTLIVGLLLAVAYVLIAATTVSDGKVLWLVIGVPATVAMAVIVSLIAGALVGRQR